MHATRCIKRFEVDMAMTKMKHSTVWLNPKHSIRNIKWSKFFRKRTISLKHYNFYFDSFCDFIIPLYNATLLKPTDN